MKLYGDRASGNCYKVILAASLLGLEYEYVAIDILAGDTQTADFLALNPNGKIPLLQLDDRTQQTLPSSRQHATLWHGNCTGMTPI